MADQVETQSQTVETQTPEQVIEDTPNAIDLMEDEFVGLSAPQPKVETTETAKETAKADTAATQTTAKEETETTTTQKDETGTPEKYEIVVSGEKKELTLDELKQHAQQGFDYTVKTQKVSDERKAFEDERNNFTAEKQRIQLENLALMVGGARKQPVLDTIGGLYDNLVERYGKEEADKYIQQHEIYEDQADYVKAKSDYEIWVNNANTVIANKQRASAENEKIVNTFKEKFKLDDKQVADLIKDSGAYLGYAQSKGQEPLPADTFEIFYKGRNYDTLLKAEIDKLNSEWENKLKDEKEKLINTMKPQRYNAQPVKRTVTQPNKDKVERSPIDELEDDIINGRNF